MSLKKQKGVVSPGQGGQILLIVILVVIISLTVGLSLASRSIINLRTSTEEAESQKALAAAEAGIERTILSSIPIGIQANNPSNNSIYFTQVTEVRSASFLINNGNEVSRHEGIDIWIVDHDNADKPIYSQAKAIPYLNLYWGSEIGCNSAAIEVVVVTRKNSLPDTDPDKFKSYRYAYDNNDENNACSGRQSENNFALAETNAPGIPIPGFDFKYKTPDNTLANGVSDVVFIRVIPIYKDTKIAVSACNHNQDISTCTDLPSQGYVIESTGKAGEASRKLTVFKGYAQAYLPYVSYGLFVAN